MIAQGDKIKAHEHPVQAFVDGSYRNITVGYGAVRGSSYGYYENYGGDVEHFYAMNTGGIENRPQNTSIKIWKRTA